MRRKMGRARRLTLTLCAAVSLTAASALPIPVLALGETSVNLSCNDGTSIDVSLDAAGLMGLKDAVEAMTLYPAGLSCSLTETSLLGAFGAGVALAGNPRHDYAVGGGQIRRTDCGIDGYQSFALSAHVDAGTLDENAGGTFNTSLLESKCPLNAGAAGRLVSKVDCLLVNGTTGVAKLTAKIEQSTFSNADRQEGDWIEITVDDSGLSPPNGTDLLGITDTTGPCAFTSEVANVQVARGNVNTHEAE